MHKITTFLTYDQQAEEAVRFYLAAFEDGRIVSTVRGPSGALLSITFELFGQQYIAMNGGPTFSFAQGISLCVNCETQAEIDRYWEKLTADGGKENPCGWLVDKFGVPWQVVPRCLPELLGGDPAKASRTVQAMLKMKKFDIAALRRAYEGA